MKFSFFLVALAVCASFPSVAVAQRAAPVATKVFAPLVDYHQHLASPAGTALLNRTILRNSLPVISVPADVRAVLDRFTSHWNDEAELSRLYSNDAIVLSNQGDPRRGWLQGRQHAAHYAATL